MYLLVPYDINKKKINKLMGNNSTSPGHGYRIISIEPNSFGSNLSTNIIYIYIYY